MKKQEVLLYGKSSDPYTEMIIDLLKFYNIDFKYMEIRNEIHIKKLKKLSGQENFPVLKIDDKVFVGFDREQIKEVLHLNKQEDLNNS